MTLSNLTAVVAGVVTFVSLGLSGHFGRQTYVWFTLTFFAVAFITAWRANKAKEQTEPILKNTKATIGVIGMCYFLIAAMLSFTYAGPRSTSSESLQFLAELAFWATTTFAVGLIVARVTTKRRLRKEAAELAAQQAAAATQPQP